MRFFAISVLRVRRHTFFLITLLLLVSTAAYNQTTDTIVTTTQFGDTATSSRGELLKPTQEEIVRTSQAELGQMSRNMESFVRMQKERETKQKRDAIIRITMGVVLFAVLIVGLRRRRKVQGK